MERTRFAENIGTIFDVPLHVATCLADFELLPAAFHIASVCVMFVIGVTADVAEPFRSGTR